MSDPFELAPAVAILVRIVALSAWVAYAGWRRPRPLSIVSVVIAYAAVSAVSGAFSTAPFGVSSTVQNAMAVVSAMVALWLLHRHHASAG